MRKPKLVVALGIVTFAGLAALAISANRTRSAYERVAAELPAAQAEARRLGFVLSGKELMPTKKVKPEDNAAPILRAAHANFKSIADQSYSLEQALIAALAEPTPDNLRAADEAWAVYEPLLKLAKQATDKPECDFERPWDTKFVWEIDQGELRTMHTLIRLLCIRANYQLKEGQVEAALDSFRQAIKLVEHAESDRNEYGAWMRDKFGATILSELAYAISQMPNDSDFLRQIESLTKIVHGALLTPHKAIRLDLLRDLQLPYFSAGDLLRLSLSSYDRKDFLQTLDTSARERYLEPPFVSRDIRIAAYQARVLQLYIDIASLHTKSQTPKETSAGMKALYDNLVSNEDPSFRLLQFSMTYTAHSFPSFNFTDAYYRVMRALLAVLIYRNTYGRYPVTLKETGCDTLDPATLGELRMRVSGDEVRVYSAGRDGEYGDSRVAGESILRHSYSDDIVAIYPRKRTTRN